MKKIILITGDACTGKTFLANSLSRMMVKPVFIDGRRLRKDFECGFILSSINEKTECVIIDDLPIVFLENVLHLFSKKLWVNRPQLRTLEVDVPVTIISIESQYCKLKIPSYLADIVHVIECSIGAVIEGPNRLFLQERITN